MAEETDRSSDEADNARVDRASGDAPKLGDAANPDAGPRGRAPAPAKTPVTEKPVNAPAARKVSQYVLTVDDTTGTVLKIDRVTGPVTNATELTQAEYTAVRAYAGLAAPYVVIAGTGTPPATGAAKSEAAAAPADLTAAVQAYYRGITEYLRALAP